MGAIVKRLSTIILNWLIRPKLLKSEKFETGCPMMAGEKYAVDIEVAVSSPFDKTTVIYGYDLYQLGDGSFKAKIHYEKT